MTPEEQAKVVPVLTAEEEAELAEAAKAAAEYEEEWALRYH